MACKAFPAGRKTVNVKKTLDFNQAGSGVSIMIIKDTQLFKIEEINDRLQSIYKQKEREIEASPKSNRMNAFKNKDVKIQKLNDRIDFLKKRIKDINSGAFVIPEAKGKTTKTTIEERGKSLISEHIDYYTASPAKNFIETIFNNSVNQWNKTALAKFLDSTTKKYNGLMDHKLLSALEILGVPEELKTAKIQIIADFIKQQYSMGKSLVAGTRHHEST